MKTLFLLPVCFCLGVVSLCAQTTQPSTDKTEYTFPTWMVGIHGYTGFGNSDGLHFGYFDAVSGAKISADPGASAGLGIFGYRRIASVWVGGAEIGFSKSSALTQVYDNITATISRGFTGEVNAGALLFAKYRHRCLLTAGAVYYSNPVLDLVINDPNGPGNATFNYNPAFGGAINAKYIFVMKKKCGELTFGLKFHVINFDLDNFEAGGTVNQPEMLNPAYSNFKNPDASNMSVNIGYQYSF